MIERPNALWPRSCAALAILGAFTILGYQYIRLGAFIMLLLQ